MPTTENPLLISNINKLNMDAKRQVVSYPTTGQTHDFKAKALSNGGMAAYLGAYL